MKKTEILNGIILLTGICFLIPQIWYTIESFIKKETTFTISKQPFDKMVPPTMLLCPQHPWDNGLWTEPKINNSDKELFFNQFYLLNEKLNLTMTRFVVSDKTGNFDIIGSNLNLGDNFDEKGNTFLVEEFINPILGMCYALTPHQSFKITIRDSILFQLTFLQKEEAIPSYILLLNPKDRYGFLLPDSEYLESFSMVQYPGTFIGIEYHKNVVHYLPTKRNCSDDHEEGSYVKCVIKNQIECYRIVGPKQGCNCIPYNILKTYFEMYPLNSWNSCQSNLEYRTCFGVMHDCYYHKMINDKCPKPCEKVVYKGIGGVAHGFPTNSNMITIKAKFMTMDVDYQDEVLVQEFYNFIGTVGGSLGLFIGFSYTGFIEKILGYFMKDNHKTNTAMRTLNYIKPTT